MVVGYCCFTALISLLRFLFFVCVRACLFSCAVCRSLFLYAVERQSSRLPHGLERVCTKRTSPATTPVLFLFLVQITFPACVSWSCLLVVVFIYIVDTLHFAKKKYSEKKQGKQQRLSTTFMLTSLSRKSSFFLLPIIYIFMLFVCCCCCCCSCLRLCVFLCSVCVPFFYYVFAVSFVCVCEENVGHYPFLYLFWCALLHHAQAALPPHFLCFTCFAPAAHTPFFYFSPTRYPS